MGRFRIKISSSWFSRNFIVLKYSTNGIFWKKVKEHEYDVLDKWYYMVTKISHYSNAKELLTKFKTIEDVKEFEANQLQIVRRENKLIAERNKKSIIEREKVYKECS